MHDIYEYIDRHADAYIEVLRSLCRQPSIAAQGVGMAETADKVLTLLKQVGADARILPTEGFPIVFGTIAGRSSKTLSFLDHCQKLGIPAVSTGVGNAESNNHAPSENVVIEDYIQGIKHIALIMEAFAAV